MTPACPSKLLQTSLSVWLTASLLQCYSRLRTKQNTLLHNVPPASQSRKVSFQNWRGCRVRDGEHVYISLLFVHFAYNGQKDTIKIVYDYDAVRMNLHAVPGSNGQHPTRDSRESDLKVREGVCMWKERRMSDV